MMRTMCTFEHGVTADSIMVIQDCSASDFNRALASCLAKGYKLIQPIESLAIMPDGHTYGKIYHVAVLAKNEE